MNSKLQKIKSMDSLSSLESIGFDYHLPGEVIDLPKFQEFSNCKLEPESSAPIDQNMYNSIAYIIYCSQHKKIVLSLSERSKAIWLPFVVLPANMTWNDATIECISNVFCKEDSELDPRLTTPIPVKSLICLHILRIQLPLTKKFIYRLIQLLTLGSNTPTFKCCQNTKRLHWIDINDAIEGNIDGLWGPEVPIFVSYIISKKPNEIYEFGLNDVLAFIPKESSTLPEGLLLLSLNLKTENFEQIYCDFLEHTFPSFNMTYYSFLNYIGDYIHECDNQESFLLLFNAINCQNSGFLNFEEFLYGLACIEPNCPNNVARMKFVFRFYDEDRDNYLNRKEMQKLLVEMNSDEQTAEKILNKMPKKIDFKKFLELDEKNVIETKILCRASNPILKVICENFQKRNEIRLKLTKNVSQTISKNKGSCLACRERKYEYGSHCVRLDQRGCCVEPRQIIECNEDVNETNYTLYKYSHDYVFSAVSIGHTFLDVIRDFCSRKTQCKEQNFFSSLPEDMELFFNYLHILCLNVRTLIECEEKLMKINSPAYVIGDFLGDIHDLIALEQALWQSLPIVNNNYVFLGNYMHNGLDNIESLLYLFCLKILVPNSFFLLRGNNEIRTNLFYRECLKKYGTKNGATAFEMLSSVFDKMPLALLIDESIICVNSGLPASTDTLESFYNFPRDLKDPLSFKLSKNVLTNLNCDEAQIINFLKRNHLSHVIRTNPALEIGFHLSADNKSIEIFSNSQKTKQNELTVICVNYPNIEIVKIQKSH